MRTAQGEAWRKWALPDADSDADVWVWQDGRCAWCGRRDTGDLVEDHCHMTGLVRGFLCRSCNSCEGWADTGAWDAWRAGDNPAYALKEFSIHVGWGGTSISPQSALHYYSRPERDAWFEQIVADMEAGAPWPEDAPWTSEATVRRELAEVQVRDAMERMWADLPTDCGKRSEEAS